MLLQFPNVPSGGSGGGNVFVFRQDEPSPSGSVFATFAGAYAAAKATGVPSRLLVDSSLALDNTAYTGTGTYDLTGVSVEGARDGQVDQLVLGDLSQNTPIIQNPSSFKNLTLYNQSNTGTPVVISGFRELTLDRASLNNQGSMPFVFMDGAEVNMRFRGSSISGSDFIRMVNNSSIGFFLLEQSSVDTNTLSDDGSSFVDYGVDLSSSFVLPQTNYTGAFNREDVEPLPDNVFIYRPNESGTRVYPTFQAVLDAVSNFNLPAIIAIDGTGVIPPGNYGLPNKVGIRGFSPVSGFDTLNFQDGAEVSVSGDVIFEHMTILANSASTTSLRVQNSGVVYLKEVDLVGVSSAPFMSSSLEGVNLVLQDSRIVGVGSGNEVIDVPANNLSIELRGQSTFDSLAIRGNSTVYLTTNSESVVKDQASFSGTINRTYKDKAGPAQIAFALNNVPQAAPFITAGNRIIWQNFTAVGNAVTRTGDQFVLHAFDGPTTFYLVGSIGATDGQVSFQWFNATDNALLGRPGSSSSFVGPGDAVAVITVPAGQTKTVELQLTYVSAATFIGQSTAAGDFFPSTFIHLVGLSP